MYGFPTQGQPLPYKNPPSIATTVCHITESTVPEIVLQNAELVGNERTQQNPMSAQFSQHPLDLDRIIIVRKIEMLPFLCSSDQANRYATKEVLTQNNYETWQRPFKASVFDLNGNHLFTIQRKYDFNLRTLVYFGPEENLTMIGSVARKWHPWRRKYKLYKSSLDSSGIVKGKADKEKILRINAGLLSWYFKCKDMNENLIATIDREFRDFAQDQYTDTGAYAISFNSRQSLAERAITLAAAVTIDADHFSRSLML
jgi:Scramblase